MVRLVGGGMVTHTDGALACCLIVLKYEWSDQR